MNQPTQGPQCRLHSVAIQTREFDRAFHFYTELLGFRVLREPYSFKGKRMLTWLDAGRCLIELYSVKQGMDPEPWSEKGLGPVNLALEVDNVDEMLDWLRGHGVTVLREPFVPPSGDPLQPRCAFIEGPDGEEILFREHAKQGALVP